MENKLTNKEMAAKIEEKYAAIPEKQISAGIYLKSVGRKYVTVINIWLRTWEDKIDISEFYDNYVKRV